MADEASLDHERFIGSDPAAPPTLAGVPPQQFTRPVLEFFARMEGPVVFERGGTRFNLPPIMAHNLPLGNAWLDYNSFLSSDKIELPVTLREIAILRIAWHMRAGYEWYQHRIIGRRCGLSDEQLNAVRIGAGADIWSEQERLAILAADEINAHDRITRETFQRMIEAFGPRKLLELMWTIGTYGMLAWINNSFEVPIEDFALKDAG
jgi:alkylhydroperoxidase family enzyme